MAVTVETAPRTLPVLVRLALAPLSALVVVLGIWIAGGVLTNDFRTSMALTAVWSGIVVVGSFLVWRAAPSLRLPVSGVAVATLVLVGGYLGLASVRDVTVNEVVAAGPASLEGAFFSLAHSTEGTVRIVEQGGGRVLTLTGFRTDPGPDLYVYLAPGLAAGESVEGATRLARLKGNVGDQQYALPPELELGDSATAVIWCRAFSVAFGAAQLSPP